MKARDLRIGNWVEGKGQYFYQVNEITRSRIRIGDEIRDIATFEYDINELKPIPLTEEWLVKFGFEKPAHSWIGDKFHLSEWDKYPLNWCTAMNKNNAIVVDKLKYVHQLQNLYFALTGTELTIKLNKE